MKGAALSLPYLARKETTGIASNWLRKGNPPIAMRQRASHPVWLRKLMSLNNLYYKSAGGRSLDAKNDTGSSVLIAHGYWFRSCHILLSSINWPFVAQN